jgi:hypothetical protein
VPVIHIVVDLLQKQGVYAILVGRDEYGLESLSSAVDVV